MAFDEGVAARNEPRQGEARGDHYLFVHAHPDDETISTGGTIATLIDRGDGVTVLSCTRGERGEVIPEELRYLEGQGPQLAALRERELAEAMRALGVTDHRFLGDADARHPGLAPRRYLDSGMVWGADGRPEPIADPGNDSLCSAPLIEVVADIARVIDETGADVVISYDERGGYGHPDHRRAHDAALQAAEMLGVPFYAIVEPGLFDDPGEAGAPTGNELGIADLEIDVTPVLERKTEALRAHATQVTVLGDRFALSSGPSRPIPTVEGFRLIDEDQEWDDDLDAELRRPSRSASIVTGALALLMGLVIGALLTVNHQLTTVIFGVTIPTGLIVVLLIVAGLLVGLRIVFDGRIVAACVALGIVIAGSVLSQLGPGGSVLVPGNTAGYVFTFGPVVIALLVLGWPSVKPSAAS